MFSTQGLVLQLSYFLLVAALLARTQQRMRLLIAASGAVALVRAVFLVQDRMTIGWMAVLLAAWLILLWSERQAGAGVRFSDEEEAMRRRVFSTVPRGAARRLIDQGYWLRGDAGDVLTREGEPVPNLYYLAEGEARVTSQGSLVGTCGAGMLVGEATILTGDPATATATLAASSRLWCAPPSSLLPFLDDHPAIRQAIERSFSVALKGKLQSANRAIARG